QRSKMKRRIPRVRRDSTDSGARVTSRRSRRDRHECGGIEPRRMLRVTAPRAANTDAGLSAERLPSRSRAPAQGGRPMHSTAIPLGMSVLLSCGSAPPRAAPGQADPKRDARQQGPPKQVVLPQQAEPAKPAAPKQEKEKAPFKPEELEQLLAAI